MSPTINLNYFIFFFASKIGGGLGDKGGMTAKDGATGVSCVS